MLEARFSTKEIYEKFSRINVAFGVLSAAVASPVITAMSANVAEASDLAQTVVGDITLKCEDGNIFEEPMIITITGNRANVHAVFSGVGGANFHVDYHSLAVLDMKLTTAAEEPAPTPIKEVTITQPHVAHARNGFQLTLKTEADGKLHGDAMMISTDSNRMTYNGAVTCTPQ